MLPCLLMLSLLLLSGCSTAHQRWSRPGANELDLMQATARCGLDRERYLHWAEARDDLKRSVNPTPAGGFGYGFGTAFLEGTTRNLEADRLYNLCMMSLGWAPVRD